ncbi:MAG: hypothetical protein ACYDH5_13330 [Acidimicrobiales bacterium]
MRDSLKQALLGLQRSGCDAAGYRLTGKTVERLCMVHLYGAWRLLLAFPEPDVAVVIDVGKHLAQDRHDDIYARLYEALGIQPGEETRTKPPCCDDADLPPVTTQLVDDLTDAYRSMTRRPSHRR